MKKIITLFFLLLLSFLLLWAQTGSTVNFAGTELLGRPASNSVTVNVAADKDLEVYFEYGTASGSYTAKTETKRFTRGTPFELVIDKLQANTRYYYRMQYREPGASAFAAGNEHTFQTQRPRGSTFTFAVQFDPHMDENSDAEVYKLTLANELSDRPDFLIDLGDTMMSDKLPKPITYDAVLGRHQLLRSYYDLVCHSAPLFLVLGNHEGEWGNQLRGTEDELPIWATKLRKLYFPNPVPDSFFSGSSKQEPFVGLRQNYYAWEWGDALFVVLDPYWYTPMRPEASGDWSLTLGREQYEWLKKTIESSTATFKFLFAHNLVGGKDMDGKMRGGIEVAKYLEWGGYNLDDTWGFDQARPGWAMPIHQLLVANNVTAFFHGHDHIYVRQELDGILYQEGPQPSARNASVGNRAATYSYTHGTVLDGVGYIRVRVSPTEVRTEFVRTWTPAAETGSRKNGEVADSHTIPARRINVKMVSAASYAGGTVAPESIVAAFGQALTSGPVAVKDSTGVERTAQVLFSSPTQVNFVVPPGTATGRAAVTIGGAVGDVLVEAVAPGVFSANANGKGVAAATAVRVKADGSQAAVPVFQCVSGSCAATPIDLGPDSDQVYVSLYGTGIRNRASLADVIAQIGGEKADVPYAGPQGGFAGLDQINLRIPRAVAGRGEVAVSLAVAGKSANTVTLSIR
jgi:uncharacterized protein (TIGR03437 family)